MSTVHHQCPFGLGRTVAVFAAIFGTGVSQAAISTTSDQDKTLTFVNCHDAPWVSQVASLTTDDKIFSTGGTTTLVFSDPDTAASGLFEYKSSAANLKLQDLGFFEKFNWGSKIGTVTTVRYAYESINGLAANVAYSYSGKWYVADAGTYSFYANMNPGCQLAIDGDVILVQAGAAACVQGIALTAGWHDFDVVLGPTSSANSSIGPANGSNGLLYSAEDVSLEDFPSTGVRFAAAGQDGSKLCVANSAAIIPRLSANGGEIVVDATYAGKNIRFAGQIYGKTDGASVNRVTLSNFSGTTVDFGGYPVSTCAYGDVTRYWHIDDWAHLSLPSGIIRRFRGSSFLREQQPAGTQYGPVCYLHTQAVNPFKNDAVNGVTTVPAGVLTINYGGPSAAFAEGEKLVIQDGTQSQFSIFLIPTYNAASATVSINEWADQVSSSSIRNNQFQRVLADVDLSGVLAFSTKLHAAAGNDACANILGAVTGSGTISGSGWGSCLTIKGGLDFDGKVVLKQLGNILRVSSASDAHISSVELGHEGRAESAKTNAGGRGATLHYRPESSEPRTLSIDTITADTTWGNAEYKTADWAYRRRGAALNVYSNNTISIASWQANSAHLRCSPAPMNSNDHYKDDLAGDHGIGYVRISTMEALGNWANIFVSTNIALTIDSLKTENIKFYYDCQEDHPNPTELNVKEQANLTNPVVFGVTPRQLPRRIKGLSGKLRFSGNSFSFPVDFGKEDICPNGCDAPKLTLDSVPDAGTISIAVEGETKPVPGTYPLLTVANGGQKLSGWTISCPSEVKGRKFQTLVTKTGVYLKVSTAGLCLIFR